MKKLISILLILIVWACQDKDPINPNTELSLNDYGDLKEITLYATADTFIVNERVNTSNSPKLCIGSFNGIEAGILMKAINLPDSGSIVDSLSIEFSTLGSLGDDIADMPVKIYRVEDEWSETANMEDKWHNYTPVSEISTIVIPSEDSSKITITITDTTLLREWIDDSFYNKGLFLKCDNQGLNYIREIASSENSVDSLLPQITYRYWDETDSLFVTDTLDNNNYLGLLDATIFDNNSDIFDIARTNNDILVASGIGATAYFQFDSISSLPKNILVQKTELFIPVLDESFINPNAPNLFDNPNDAQGFYTNMVLDSGDVLMDTEIDSSSLNSITLSDKDSLVEISNNASRAYFGKYFIQEIINGNVASEWFSLEYGNQGQDLSIKRFQNLQSDPARLVIKYFQVKQSGF
ncbi:MAG: DNRLRE domain-containing protein [Calditrichaceae bacterium]|jgi:hypothetical protein